VLFFTNGLIALIEKGISREDAYAVVQKNAMKSWQKGVLFKGLLEKDALVKKHLGPKELAEIFQFEKFFKKHGFHFKRAFAAKD
jgi:adenylosuccinate lyase